jgi:DNA-binding MarR family transcriptional regulator
MNDPAAIAIDEHEFSVLEEMMQAPLSLSQRELSKRAGLSLGLTNVLIKRLVQRGWVSLRRVNGRNLSYALTPEGFDALARRSWRFIKRTFGELKGYYDKIDRFMAEKASEGYETVLLEGLSELDFVLEQCARKHGMGFSREPVEPGRSPSPGVLRLAEESPGPGAVSLQGILLSMPSTREAAHA